VQLLISLLVGSVFAAAFVVLNERIGLLRRDRFPTQGHKWGAYVLLWLYASLFVQLVAGSSGRTMKPAEIQSLPFWSVFTLHIVLIIFLVGWWLLTSRPRIGEYLNLHKSDAGPTFLTGIAVGVGGWALTIALAIAIGSALMAMKLAPENLKPSPMIPWLANMPIWQKCMVVFAAMTVEEAFFRGWLQKRVGLVASTMLFALAHAGYGQPMMLIGVTIVSVVIGYTFYRTKNLWPCIIAHGVFDAIQIFVIVPAALKFMPV
jgi:membrane protease YdiL (CAAX protease family)